MKIETIISAKSIWLFDLRTINPRGRNLYRIIIPILQQWYGFVPPTEIEEEKGVRFAGGEFSPSGRGDDMTGVEIVIYNDGVVATCATSTEDSDAFLELVCVRLAKEGIISYSPELVSKKQYVSEVFARSDKPLSLPQLNPVYNVLSKFIGLNEVQLSWSSLKLDVDPTVASRQVTFKFERRASKSFDQNLWYSHGPLTTTQHQAVLNAIEVALATT